MNLKPKFFKILIPAILLLMTACGQGTHSKSPTSQLKPTNLFMNIIIDYEGGNWIYRDFEIEPFLEATMVSPNINGDSIAKVLDAQGQIQYMTLFSRSYEVKVTGTSLHSGETVDESITSTDPIVIRLPIYQNTRKIIVKEMSGTEFELPLPFDFEEIPEELFLGKRALSYLDAKIMSKLNLKESDTSGKAQELVNTYPGIDFKIVAGDRIPILEDKYASLILKGLNTLPTPQVLGSVRSVYIKDLNKNIKEDLEQKGIQGTVISMGFHTGAGNIYIDAASVMNASESIFLHVFLHEVAHRYDHYVGNIDYDFSEEEWLFWDGIMRDLPFSDPLPRPSEKLWEIQKAYGSLRYQNHDTCKESEDEVFDMNDYWYAYDNGTRASNFFENGFTTPYGSSNEKEDLAEFFSYSVLKPELVAQYWEENNVYDQKLKALLETFMITDGMYQNIKELAEQNIYQYTLSYRYYGVSFPISLYLNGHELPFPFHGFVGNTSDIIPNEFLNTEGSNVLSITTDYSEVYDDWDDIEIKNLRLRSSGPISAETGCEQSDVIAETGLVHLGDGNCPNDIYCPFYSELKGETYEWEFELP